MRSTSISASDGVIEGNFIGTNATGTAALPNGASGNGGIVLFSGFNNTHWWHDAGSPQPDLGKYRRRRCVGRAPTASSKATSLAPMSPAAVAIGNTQAQDVTSGGGNLIGGDTAAAGNVISGNDRGIELGSGDVVQGNFIGTDLTGTIACAKSKRRRESSEWRHDRRANVHSRYCARQSHLWQWHRWFSHFHRNDTVKGNIIGADITGTQPLGNEAGISIVRTAGSNVGGTEAGAGNIVAFNGTLCEAQ